MIESYTYGKMVVDGQTYTEDVVVYPDRVEAKWKRKDESKLDVEDVRPLIEKDKPEVLVVGTGKHSLLKISREVREYLASQGVKLVAETTDLAMRSYNLLLKKGTRTVGAFALTR